MRRHRRSGSTTALLGGLAVIVIGLALSTYTGAAERESGVVPAVEPASTATTLTVPLPGSQSDPLTECTRYSQTFGSPCNPLLDVCVE